MPSLLALDFPLGPTLVEELVECAMTSQAFCVLDQRLSPRKRQEILELLGATHVRSAEGTVAIPSGTPVEEGDGLVMLTSGSSGTPKAAIHTWASLVASADITQRSLRGEQAPVWLPLLPPAHIGGLAVLLRHVLNDADFRWTSDIEDGPRMGATHVAVVRAQLARHDLSGYEKVLVGGGKPPTSRADNVIATWGMTETGSGVVYDGYPLDEVAIRVIDSQICVHSPTLFRAYRSSERPRIDLDGQEWFPTGDGGELVDGRLRVFGRLGSVIVTGGEKVWPEDLEALFAQVDHVRDVAVVGIDDNEWGQRVVALVVSDTPVDDELLERAAERIGPWAKPKEIRYVAAIPRTANGKIARAGLEHLY